MKQGVVFSIGLHLLVVTVTVIVSPLNVRHQMQGEVITVSLTSAPFMPAAEPVELPPVEIPRALEPEPVEVPINEPTTAPAAEITEPEDEPQAEEEREEKPYQPQAEQGATRQPGSDSGSAEVSASGGTPFAGATIDNASFDYPYWFTQAFYKIQSNWRNPIAADYSIVCDVYFQVLKSGRVIELRVEEPSGIRAYDEACVRAVERAAPFPPLPQSFPDEIIGITLPFKYEP
ncbi:MAG TPA: TonB family protein [Acidobacteriota bacterium]|nr:TonB family protein [Acidobacteriota bacterium]